MLTDIAYAMKRAIHFLANKEVFWIILIKIATIVMSQEKEKKKWKKNKKHMERTYTMLTLHCGSILKL